MNKLNELSARDVAIHCSTCLLWRPIVSVDADFSLHHQNISVLSPLLKVRVEATGEASGAGLPRHQRKKPKRPLHQLVPYWYDVLRFTGCLQAFRGSSASMLSASMTNCCLGPSVSCEVPRLAPLSQLLFV